MKNKIFVGTIIVAVLMMGMGFLVGYYYATGDMPSIGYEPTSYLPPTVSSEVDMSTVATAVEEDPVDKQEYRVGYNCLDFAWDAMRNLSWQGIPSYVAAIQFEDGSNHAVIAIPTNDANLLWFDPQNDKQIEPGIGKVYMGKRITGFLIMQIEWLSLDEFADLMENMDA